MAEESAISWTDATFNPCSPWERIAPKVCAVGEGMAPNAKCYAVFNVKSQFWIFCKLANMVGIQVPTAIIAAMAACKTIAR